MNLVRTELFAGFVQQIVVLVRTVVGLRHSVGGCLFFLLALGMRNVRLGACNGLSSARALLTIAASCSSVKPFNALSTASARGSITWMVRGPVACAAR